MAFAPLYGRAWKIQVLTPPDNGQQQTLLEVSSSDEETSSLRVTDIAERHDCRSRRYARFRSLNGPRTCSAFSWVRFLAVASLMQLWATSRIIDNSQVRAFASRDNDCTPPPHPQESDASFIELHTYERGTTIRPCTP